MTIEFEVSGHLLATPQQVYDAWLESEGHTAMTGGKAECSDAVGGEFTAWDGYISGRNVALESGSRIVQSWRTTQFADDELDSQIELLFEGSDGGTRVTLSHTNVPDGGEHYQSGWQSHYLEPMADYFASSP